VLRSIPAASNSTNGNQNTLQPSHLISNHAVAWDVSSEKLQLAYNEKLKLVKSHFPGQSKEWQHWFVEATAWGQLCMFAFKILLEYPELIGNSQENPISRSRTQIRPVRRGQ
jgi:hypothetical protein